MIEAASEPKPELVYRSAVLSVVAACSSPPATAPPPDAAPPVNGGSIVVAVEPEGTMIHVELYATAVPPDVPRLIYGDDHCDVLLGLATPPEVAATDRDLGPQITAVGAFSVTAPVDTTGGKFIYEHAIVTTVSGFGWTWTVASAAGPIADVVVPAQVDQREITVVHTASGPETLHFSGGAGADYIHLHLGGEGGVADCYPIAGATTFTASAALLDAIVGHGRVFNLNVFANTRSLAVIDGRTVEVVGIAQNLD